MLSVGLIIEPFIYRSRGITRDKYIYVVSVGLILEPFIYMIKRVIIAN